MKRVVLAAAAALTFPVVGAAAPATFGDTVIAAADYWRSQGVRVDDVTIGHEDHIARNDGSPLASDAHAQRPGGTVIRVVNGIDQMYSRPVLAQLALHEAVHAAQGMGMWRLPRSFVEGQADALAADHLCPFMARVWGRDVAYAECGKPYVQYREESSSYRRLSIAATGRHSGSYESRVWRLRDLQLTAAGGES